MPIWHLPPAPLPLEPLPESTLAAVRRAREEVAERLSGCESDYPPVGRLALTGHASPRSGLALATGGDRGAKGRRTFATVLGLMERYPDFTFNQSSAQLYAWIEQEAPDLFARVKERVAEGRWEPIGGSWVEPDCQVTGGEAFVRQLFYGQRAFEAWFGQRSTVAWLPDVFGFSGGIPQLLRGAGLEGFFTSKLNRNEEDRFPYDLFAWEGIDGSRVTATMFRNLLARPRLRRQYRPPRYPRHLAQLRRQASASREPARLWLGRRRRRTDGAHAGELRAYQGVPGAAAAAHDPHRRLFRRPAAARIARLGGRALPGVPPRHADDPGAKRRRSTAPPSTG